MDQETAGYMWRYDRKVVLATVCPARTRIDPVLASTTGARRCANGCDSHIKIGTQNAMTEVTNHIQMLLNSTGRSEHLCPRYNDCAMVMNAEMGSSRKAMIRPGISFDKSSNKQKQKHASDKGKQKNTFAGTAKKKKKKT